MTLYKWYYDSIKALMLNEMKITRSLGSNHKQVRIKIKCNDNFF